MSRTAKIRSLNKINDRELQAGVSKDINKSWHRGYADSAWVYIGGLNYDLNEGDVLSVFSQYGEIVNINLVRDSKTGKSKGFAFLCYQDQRSTILAVDNFNGIKLCNRPIQVDHCDYKAPKYKESIPKEILKVWEEGCAPKPINVTEDELKAQFKAEKKEKKKKLKKLKTFVPLDDDKGTKEIRKAKKRLKKERKERKKMEEHEKKLEMRLKSLTPEDERGRPDDEGHWDAKKKKIDDNSNFDDDKFYGVNDHFKFGSKKRKEVPPPPTHNVRPDFDKADWRDIEMFKIAREQERQKKGEKSTAWKEEEHYVPKRLGGGN